MSRKEWVITASYVSNRRAEGKNSIEKTREIKFSFCSMKRFPFTTRKKKSKIKAHSSNITYYQ